MQRGGQTPSVASARARCPFELGAMFTLFERLLKPTAPPEQAVPPPGFVAYFWHFARQAKGLFAALFAAGLVVALLDSTVPVFMGRIVTLITAGGAEGVVSEIFAPPLGLPP